MVGNDDQSVQWNGVDGRREKGTGEKRKEEKEKKK